MHLVVRAFPLTAHVEDLTAFAADLNGPRSAETRAFYERLGVRHESWHVQKTPLGPWVICCTLVDDVERAAPLYAQSEARFDAWFKERVRQLTGIDPNENPLGPPTQPVFRWPLAGGPIAETPRG
ncbi:MAG: hypothetical protein Q8L86_18370 [Vicinamibacterales bacterium]|nr:hypothetical protein [Vicinamibacterales bacterium]